MKNITFFLSENFQFLVIKLSVYLNRHVFAMRNKTVVFLVKTAENYKVLQVSSIRLFNLDRHIQEVTCITKYIDIM